MGLLFCKASPHFLHMFFSPPAHSPAFLPILASFAALFDFASQNNTLLNALHRGTQETTAAHQTPGLYTRSSKKMFRELFLFTPQPAARLRETREAASHLSASTSEKERSSA